jgi:REP element-mobilizing transposase RayT
MPRYARFHVTGGLFHVISRFHDRRFYLDIDGAREKYLEALGNALETHDSRVVAYCLMSSHVHLVLQLGNDPLGTLTKKVHSPFANWINSRRKGLGAIFADRPKSVLVHSETHGMALVRYVHNNPVRAGVVAGPSESPWSSHQAYLGLMPCPPWLATEAVLGPNVKEHEQLRHELACYVDEGRTEGRRPEFSGEVSKSLAKRVRKLMGGDVELSYPILGPDEFVVSALREQVRRHRDRRRIGAEGGEFNRLTRIVFEDLDLDPELASKRVRARKVARGRALAAYLWVERLGGPQGIVASEFGVSPAAVTLMLTKLRRDGLGNREEELIQEIYETLVEEDAVNGGTGEGETSKNTTPEPRVVILKRQR